MVKIKKLIMLLLFLVSLVFAQNADVYSPSYSLKYHVENGRIYDKNWNT